MLKMRVPIYVYYGELLCELCAEKACREFREREGVRAEECWPLAKEEVAEFTQYRSTCADCGQELVDYNA